MSIPFNFSSENANGVSSMYGSSSNEIANPRSKRLWKAGFSIIGGGVNISADKITTVRIRGKQTGIILYLPLEMKDGMIDKTLEQQEKIKSQRKEFRRANERLRNLEIIEKYRQIKVKEEIERLEQQRRNDEMIKQQKIKDDLERRAMIGIFNLINL